MKRLLSYVPKGCDLLLRNPFLPPARIWTACVAAALLSLSFRLPAQQIALTMDDLPAHGPLPPDMTRMDVVHDVLQALGDAHLPPTYGFVNGIHVEEQPKDREVLDAWRAAGNPLGNHTWSHMDLNKHSLEEFKADLTHNEPLLAEEMGTKSGEDDWHWLRFPFLSEGDTPEKKAGVRQFLSTNGYRIAGVTMSFGDYLWNDPYARCSAKGDAAAISELEVTYLAAAREEALRQQALSKELYQREIPFVLLMHIGAFDAQMLPRLLAQYRAMGFSFITLQEAERDVFYKSDLHPEQPVGFANLASAAKAEHKTMPAGAKPQSANLDGMCR